MATNTTTALDTKTVVIDTDLSDKVYHFVSYDATDQNVVNLAETGAVTPFVLVEDGDGSSTPLNGTIANGGTFKIKLGGTVEAGDFLMPTTNGVAIVATTDKRYGAVAAEGGVSGDIISCTCERGVYYAA
jgi:hypothetical protein